MLDWDTVRARANDDGEFRLHARLWTATVRLGIGHRNYKMRIDDGSVRSIERWPGGVATDLAIHAPQTDWEAMLAKTPRPFYQDLYGRASITTSRSRATPPTTAPTTRPFGG